MGSFRVFYDGDVYGLQAQLEKEEKMSLFDGKAMSIFAGGILAGTAGIKILGSKDAKKAYAHCVAAGLRAKDCIMDAATKVQENAEDVLAEAVQINEERAVAEKETKEKGAETEAMK